jgi:hypothetical protein
MNRQQVFDDSFTRIYKQGKRAYSNNRCQYLAEDKSRCAVGILLTEEQAAEVPNEAIGNMHVLPTVNHYLTPIYGQIDVSEGDLDFLADIQHAHDNCKFGEKLFRKEWCRAMSSVADTWNLSEKVFNNV